MHNVYVDASYCHKTKKAGLGITHNNVSLSIKAYGSLDAELQAVIKGVRMIRKGIVYTDCMVIVKAIKDRRHLVRHEEQCIKLLAMLKDNKNVEVKWVKRDNNTKADALARMGRKLCV